MSTRPGSHFRTEPTGRELRVRLMAACGASVSFMAEAEGCGYNTIKALCWRHGITYSYSIDMTTRAQRKGHAQPRKAQKAWAAPVELRHALDAWMHRTC